MKKQIVAVILLIGLSNATMLPNITRHVHCLLKPSKSKQCSKEEIQAARAWLGRNSLRALGALLLAAGATAATIFAVKQVKKRQWQEEKADASRNINYTIKALKQAISDQEKHKIIEEDILPLLEGLKESRKKKGNNRTKKYINAFEPLKDYLNDELIRLREKEEETEYSATVSEVYFDILNIQEGEEY